MDYREFMHLLKSYRQQLSFQQFSTLRGQAKAGDIDAATRVYKNYSGGMQTMLIERKMSQSFFLQITILVRI